MLRLAGAGCAWYDEDQPSRIIEPSQFCSLQFAECVVLCGARCDAWFLWGGLCGWWVGCCVVHAFGAFGASAHSLVRLWHLDCGEGW